MIAGLFCLLITINWCLLLAAALIPRFGIWLYSKGLEYKMWIDGRLETLFKGNSFPVE